MAATFVGALAIALSVTAGVPAQAQVEHRASYVAAGGGVDVDRVGLWFGGHTDPDAHGLSQEISTGGSCWQTSDTMARGGVCFDVGQSVRKVRVDLVDDSGEAVSGQLSFVFLRPGGILEFTEPKGFCGRRSLAVPKKMPRDEVRLVVEVRGPAEAAAATIANSCGADDAVATTGQVIARFDLRRR